MRDQLALVRANCAQTCLKLERFDDAHLHSCECIRIDPQNHKGYFRKAEALRSMLASSSSVAGTHMDVVKDYLKCHNLQTNVDAFSKAVITAVEHSESCSVDVRTVVVMQTCMECDDVQRTVVCDHDNTLHVLLFG